jgi:hypothetical protein
MELLSSFTLPNIAAAAAVRAAGGNLSVRPFTVPRFNPDVEQFHKDLPKYEKMWDEAGILNEDGDFAKGPKYAFNLIAKAKTHAIIKGATLEYTVNARLVIGDFKAVLIDQIGANFQDFQFSLADLPELGDLALSAIGHLSPGQGGPARTVIAPEEPEEEAWDDQWSTSHVPAKTQSSYQKQSDRDRTRILRDAQAVGEFRFFGRDPHNARTQSPFALEWLDTQSGRYTAWKQTKPTGEIIATYEPAHEQAMKSKLVQAIDAVRS